MIKKIKAARKATNPKACKMMTKTNMTKTKADLRLPEVQDHTRGLPQLTRETAEATNDVYHHNE